MPALGLCGHHVLKLLDLASCRSMNLKLCGSSYMYVLQLKEVMTAVAVVRSSVANQLADRIGGASAMGGAEMPLKTIETSTTAPCHCFGTGRRRNTPQMLSRTQPLTIESRAPRVSSSHAQNGMVTVNAMPAVLACAPMSASDQP